MLANGDTVSRDKRGLADGEHMVESSKADLVASQGSDMRIASNHSENRITERVGDIDIELAQTVAEKVEGRCA